MSNYQKSRFVLYYGVVLELYSLETSQVFSFMFENRMICFKVIMFSAVDPIILCTGFSYARFQKCVCARAPVLTYMVLNKPSIAPMLLVG